jgi:hypothetical protein
VSRPPRLHRVAVLNRSTVATDDEVHAITSALQKQVDRHFSPTWGIGAKLHFVPSTDMTSWSQQWNLVVLDTSDEANALGYHDLTPEGLPLGKCFAKTDLAYGAKLSVTMSHELLEMLGDPNINLCSQADDGTIYAYENCDAVEADESRLRHRRRDGLRLRPAPSGSCRGRPQLKGGYSHGGHVTRPFELAKGGYISIFRDGRWTQLFAEQQQGVELSDEEKHVTGAHYAVPDARPRVGSRRERRATGPLRWHRSIA